MYNEIGYGQELFSSHSGVVDDGPDQAITYAYLIRITDPMTSSWLSDLSFVETAGLAPGPNATNWLYMSRLRYTRDVATGEIQAVLPDPLSGTFIVTSMTAVPEPGLGAQASAGVAILGLLLRRRAGSLRRRRMRSSVASGRSGQATGAAARTRTGTLLMRGWPA